MCRFELFGTLLLLSHDIVSRSKKRSKDKDPAYKPPPPPIHPSTKQQIANQKLKSQRIPRFPKMLHEILLSLSGHPSPLLTNPSQNTTTTSLFSPPELALLSSLAHLSTLHRKLLSHTATIASSHPSSICQAVATAISSTHLAQFQRKIIEVEQGILRKDAGSVGAYSIVPLTAVVGEFAPWTRRMDWFLEVAEFMVKGGGGNGERKCSGAMVIDRLCSAMQTGYIDIEEAALSLVRVAETAWLKQVSAWVLYGRLPSFGKGDFFVQEIEGPVGYLMGRLVPCDGFLTGDRNMKSKMSCFLRLSQHRQLLRYYSLVAL